MATLGRSPPFVASRHFPRFIGDIYPAIESGVAVLSFVLQSSGSPRYARDDGKLYVIPSKTTRYPCYSADVDFFFGKPRRRVVLPYNRGERESNSAHSADEHKYR